MGVRVRRSRTVGLGTGAAVTYRDRVTRMRRMAALTLAAAVLATPATTPTGALAAPRSDVPPGLAEFYGQDLSWSGCGDGLQCAWLRVPLDYDDPSGDTIRLRLARVPATGSPGQRQGSLLLNPGGPGASGLSFASYVASAVAPQVAREFDIVGFDTRGVGQSAAVTCLTGRQTSTWLRADSNPDTLAEEKRYFALGGRIPRGCLEFSPKISRHLGSEDTARDMDVMRAVLGDEKLTYLGYSYGTFLGTLYAERFPGNVGRLVLDGALDPSLDVMQVSEGQSDGFQLALTRFAADCAKRSSCPWRGSSANVLRGINRLLAQIDRRPLPTGTARDLVEGEAITALFTAMYSPSSWSSLRYALRLAAKGDGSGLQWIADSAADRTGPTSFGTNMASAFPAIACWDTPAAPGLDGLRAAADRWSRKAKVPALARALSWSNAPCSQWFGHTARVPAPASSTTTAPILVVGTTYDPATPYAWSQALSRQLATATLLTYRGDGHTAYGSGSRCVDDAIDAYLLRGTVPAAGTVCR